MKTLDRVNWGVIGCGDVCEVKSAPAMNKIPGSKLVAVMRRSEEKIRDYATRHGVGKWYTDADALIDDPEINAIYIATPPNSHLEYTKKAALAGKAVYVEKPMALNYAQCREMIRICEAAKVPLFVAYYRRALPNFLKVKSLIENGAIGAIRYVKIDLNQALNPEVIRASEKNWRVNPEISGGGYFYDLASHQFDYLDFLFGPVAIAKGVFGNQAGQYAAEDIVMAAFQFENGVLGSGSWCFTASEHAKSEFCTVIGERGFIRFHFFTSSKVYLETDHIQEVFDFEMPGHIQQPLIEAIVGELTGHAEKSPSDGISASRTNLVLESIVK